MVHEEAMLEAVRRVQGREWVDRLEATVEAHILPAAHVREAAGIPGTTVRTAWLCRDKPAMKEALRAAGVAARAVARASRRRRSCAMFAAEIGYPLILKPRSAAGASGTTRVANDRELESAIVEYGTRPRRLGRRRGVRRGPRGLLRHDLDRRHGRARVHLALLPERARGDAHALDLAADRDHEPGRTPPATPT